MIQESLTNLVQLMLTSSLVISGKVCRQPADGSGFPQGHSPVFYNLHAGYHQRSEISYIRGILYSFHRWSPIPRILSLSQTFEDPQRGKLVNVPHHRNSIHIIGTRRENVVSGNFDVYN